MTKVEQFCYVHICDALNNVNLRMATYPRAAHACYIFMLNREQNARAAEATLPGKAVAPRRGSPSNPFARAIAVRTIDACPGGRSRIGFPANRRRTMHIFATPLSSPFAAQRKYRSRITGKRLRQI